MLMCQTVNPLRDPLIKPNTDTWISALRDDSLYTQLFGSEYSEQCSARKPFGFKAGSGLKVLEILWRNQSAELCLLSTS